MHRSSIGLGRQPFTLERRVRFLYGVPKFNGQVGEWLIPADCKSAALWLRQFESSPIHQFMARQMSWLDRMPVTHEARGSSPLRVAKLKWGNERLLEVRGWQLLNAQFLNDSNDRRFKRLAPLMIFLRQFKSIKQNYWKSGRAVECNGLENRRTERYREFESHLFRQTIKQGQ